MNSLDITTIVSLSISSISTIIVGISAFLLWRQIKSTHNWNRRKTSQEILNNLVTGEFPQLRYKLEQEFNCVIWDKSHSYETKVKNVSEKGLVDLNYHLSRILNIFETIAINIKNNIIEEDICYDFMGWIFTEYYRWSRSYIEEKRQQAGDQRVLGDFTNFADKWVKRMQNEREKMDGV